LIPTGFFVSPSTTGSSISLLTMTQITRSLIRPSFNLETPFNEPLPLYSPPARGTDSETASIHSEAPSYRSEAPPYSPPAATITNPRNDQPRGLPYRRYAPGFQARPHGSVADIKNHNYNVSNWSSVRTGLASKQYENVAKRRVQRDDAVAGLLCSLTLVQVSPASSSTTTSATAPVVVEEPHNPMEDPALVGETAAARAKEQRLYRENCMRDSREALRYESKSWDFMLAQMVDWDEREQSWNKFRKEVAGGRRKMLARRIGFRG
jgi:hypothetical protein